MVINVHGGHNRIVPGASGYLDEVTEDRAVTAQVIAKLRALGHTVFDCTDDSGRTQGQNLANIVHACNAHAADLDVSIHLNSGGGTGTEVLVYSDTGAAAGYAVKICAAIAAFHRTAVGCSRSVIATEKPLRQSRQPMPEAMSPAPRIKISTLYGSPSIGSHRPLRPVPPADGRAPPPAPEAPGCPPD